MSMVQKKRMRNEHDKKEMRMRNEYVLREEDKKEV